jgi:hypothetical protein
MSSTKQSLMIDLWKASARDIDVIGPGIYCMISNVARGPTTRSSWSKRRIFWLFRLSDSQKNDTLA